MPTVLEIEPDDVERVAAQAGQPLAAHRREDRVHEPVEPRDLVGGAGPPVLDRVDRRAGGVRRGRVGEQVDVGAHDRERRPELVGHDREQLRARGVELAQPVQLRLGLRLHPALLDDAGEQRGDRRQEVDLLAGELADRRSSGR